MQIRLRIVFAVAVSVTLHAGLIAYALHFSNSNSDQSPTEPVRLVAKLLPRAEEAAPMVDGLIKNTLTPREPEAPPLRESVDDRLRGTTPATTPRSSGRPQAVHEVQQRLAQVMLYPPEALEQGLEGEVILLLDIDAQGRVAAASVASGSGHAMLDDAALRAVQTIGALSPAVAGRTILLPVRFQLR